MRIMLPILLLGVIACEAPQAIDLRAKINQYNDDAPICLGAGVSTHLTSEVGFDLVWEMHSDFSGNIGYTKEYCMLNDESDVSTKISAGVGYRFDL